MLTSQGRIVRSDDGRLLMQAECLESCKACGVNRLCSGRRRTQLLSLPASEHVWLEGQCVQAHIEEGELLRIALLVYSLPCIMMIITAVLASFWGNVATAIGCGVGLVMGILISRQIALHKPPRVHLMTPPIDPDTNINPLGDPTKHTLIDANPLDAHPLNATSRPAGERP